MVKKKVKIRVLLSKKRCFREKSSIMVYNSLKSQKDKKVFTHIRSSKATQVMPQAPSIKLGCF